MQVIGKHDQPIRNMKFLPNHNVLVTGSWDKSVRIWDTRSPNAVANIQLTERVYAMDAKGEAIVIGTADKKLHVYNIANLGQKAGEFDSSLKYQTRTISIFHDMQGGIYTHSSCLVHPRSHRSPIMDPCTHCSNTPQSIFLFHDMMVGSIDLHGLT